MGNSRFAVLDVTSDVPQESVLGLLQSLFSANDIAYDVDSNIQGKHFKCDIIYSPQNAEVCCVRACVIEWVNEWVSEWECEPLPHITVYGHLYITSCGHAWAVTAVTLRSFITWSCDRRLDLWSLNCKANAIAFPQRLPSLELAKGFVSTDNFEHSFLLNNH